MARYTSEQRHPHHLVACTVCGTQVRRRVDSARKPTCSVACRKFVQSGSRQPSAAVYVWETDVVKRVREAECAVVEEVLRADVFTRDDWTCQGCGITCTQPDPFVLTSATVDHVVALARGGEHSMANVQTLCLSCNARKSDRAA